MDSSEHQALLPLDESWRCDRGMELYEVPCAKKREMYLVTSLKITIPSKTRKTGFSCVPMLLVLAVLLFVRSAIPFLSVIILLVEKEVGSNQVV